MIREILKMLNQYAVDNLTLPVNLRFSHLFEILAECKAVLLGMPSRNDKPPSIWDTHAISGNVFVNPTASLSAPYPQGFNPWISNVSEHTSPHVMSESQTPVQDQRCQSGPSARNSFVPGEGRFSNNDGADQQRLQISDPHFDKFPTPTTFACWRIRFKTEVCTCSQFPTEAMLWIKEVEMISNLRVLSEEFEHQNFEVLDAKIASALNRIIHNTPFERKVSLEEQKKPKRGPFPSWKTDRLLVLRVLQGHWSQRFCRELCWPIYNCSSKWWHSGIRFEMRRNSIINDENPIYDILEGLYTLRIRESLSNSRPYWNCTIWRFIRRKLDLSITDWRQWWKEVSSKIYEFWVSKSETEIMRQTPRSRIMGQNSVNKEKSRRLLAVESQRAVF